MSMGDGDAVGEKQKAPVTVVSANERLARSQTYTVAGLQLEGLSVGGQVGGPFLCPPSVCPLQGRSVWEESCAESWLVLGSPDPARLPKLQRTPSSFPAGVRWGDM